MITNYEDQLQFMVFTDESRFVSGPDNRCRWIQSNDFREKMCAQYSKSKFATMIWWLLGLDSNPN